MTDGPTVDYAEMGAYYHIVWASRDQRQKFPLPPGRYADEYWENDRECYRSSLGKAETKARRLVACDHADFDQIEIFMVVRDRSVGLYTLEADGLHFLELDG